MTSRRTSPAHTPFIPPLGSPHGSSGQPSPVIPTSGGSPNWHPGNIPPPGSYPAFHMSSPYLNSNNTPFIPQFSPAGTPGVVPGSLPPSRQGVSPDYTGYPGQSTPYTSPTNMAFGPTSPAARNPYGQPTSPWFGGGGHIPPPAVAFGGTPWPPAAPLLSTPWNQPHHSLPQQGGQHIPPPQAGPYTPAFAMGPPAGWPGGPPPGAPNYFGGPPAADPWGYFGAAAAQPPRAPPEPPSQAHDRLNPFLEGRHYGPVLDPFLLRVVGATLRLNPLLSMPEDTGDSPYLRWNMLFPSSTVQRSDDPSHVSWSKGRNAPATWPRVSALRLASEVTPWLIDVRARDKEIGVTCGEVIDAIAKDMNRFSVKEDFSCLSVLGRREVTSSYNHNRSRGMDVPGGALGEGMRRLDFLRNQTMFSGVEVNDRVVKKLCGSVMPCVVVLKSSTRYPMSKKELEDQEARLRNGSGSGGGKVGGRSRAGSTNTKISVRPPSPRSDGDSDDSR